MSETVFAFTSWKAQYPIPSPHGSQDPLKTCVASTFEWWGTALVGWKKKRSKSCKDAQEWFRRVHNKGKGHRYGFRALSGGATAHARSLPPNARDFLEEESVWRRRDGNCANQTKGTGEKQQQKITNKKKVQGGGSLSTVRQVASRTDGRRTTRLAPPEKKEGKEKKASCRQLHRKSVVLCLRLEWVDKKRPTRKEPRVGRLCRRLPSSETFRLLRPLAAWSANSSVEQPAHK